MFGGNSWALAPLLGSTDTLVLFPIKSISRRHWADPATQDSRALSQGGHPGPRPSRGPRLPDAHSYGEACLGSSLGG